MLEAKKKRALIIDPLVSAPYLAESIKRSDIEIIALYTRADQLSERERKIRICPELFTQTIYFSPASEKLEELAKQIRALDVDFIFSGCESSIPLTDQLLQLLDMPYKNNPTTSLARCDKYHMQEALKRVGLPSIAQMIIASRTLLPQQISELKEWPFPLLAKPRDGAGSAGVKTVHSLAELQTHLKNAPTRALSTEINDFVLQELLVGDEYFVDTFSALGQHAIVSVQRYRKTDFQGHAIYRYCEIVDPQSCEYKIASEYVISVLNAVELANGFAHTELFLTATGPRLIEVNPRISGALGFPNKMAEKTVGISQPQALTEFLTNGSLNLAERQLTAYGRVVFLQNWHPRVIGELNVAKLRELPSYVEHRTLHPSGTVLGMPSSLPDTVAYVLLVNPDQGQLIKDYEQLKYWEEHDELF